MRRLLQSIPLLALALLLLGLTGRAAADVDADFRAAKRELQQQMRSREPADRVAALERLTEFPIVDAVKLIVPLAFKNQTAEVREAALKTLFSFKDDPQVCEYLLQTLNRDKARKMPEEASDALLLVLLSSELPEVQEDLFAFLDAAGSQPRSGPPLSLVLADSLGQRGDEASAAALVRLASCDSFGKHFAFRRAVIQALSQIRHAAAIDAMLEILPKVEGEARADIFQHLSSVSGQPHGPNAEAWIKWWQENKKGFKFPNEVQRAGFRETAVKGTPSYYGLPLYGARIVFVMDTSGSMAGPRLVAAKRELLGAIQALPPGVSFAVLVFNNRVTPWQRELVLASDEAKQQASQFVDSQGVQSRTASYDALEAAFTFDAETIYFLSDGAPFGGKVVKPVEIVALITQFNRARRISVNTIGIGAGQPGSVFDAFLSTLASRNFGSYRRVDQ